MGCHQFRGPNTNGSQFFITFGPAAHLNGRHVVFGELVCKTKDSSPYCQCCTGLISHKIILVPAQFYFRSQFPYVFPYVQHSCSYLLVIIEHVMHATADWRGGCYSRAGTNWLPGREANCPGSDTQHWRCWYSGTGNIDDLGVGTPPPRIVIVH